MAVAVATGAWFFLYNPTQAQRKSVVGVGPDGDNKLKGSKHRAAKMLEQEATEK